MADPVLAKDEMERWGDYVDFALRFPESRGWRTVFRGGLVMLAGILVLPYPLLVGYMIRAVEAAADGASEVPAVDRFGEMYRRGLGGILAVLPLVALTLAAELPPLYGCGGALAWIPFAMVVAGTQYIYPAVFVRYAVTGSVRAAYDPVAVRETVATRWYLGHFLLFWLIYLLLAAIAVAVTALSVLTVIGWIVAVPAVMFYLNVAWAGYWGRVFHERASLAEEIGGGDG